jgi:hypothetical protein
MSDQSNQRKYYMTGQEFFCHLEAAVKETYGENWDTNKWHPEDLAANIEASLSAIRGFLASAIWAEAASSKMGKR